MRSQDTCVAKDGGEVWFGSFIGNCIVWLRVSCKQTNACAFG